MEGKQSFKCLVSMTLINIFIKLTKVNRISYQKKGWTDGEIGAEWIKIFEKGTAGKANGQY